MLLNPALLELTSAIALVMILEMMVFYSIFLQRADRDLRDGVDVYAEYSAARAGLVFLFGLALAFGSRWMFRYLQSRGYTIEFMRDMLTIALIAGTAIFTIGGVCTIRVLMPRTMRSWVWVALGLLAVVGGWAITYLT